MYVFFVSLFHRERDIISPGITMDVKFYGWNRLKRSQDENVSTVANLKTSLYAHA